MSHALSHVKNHLKITHSETQLYLGPGHIKQVGRVTLIDTERLLHEWRMLIIS